MDQQHIQVFSNQQQLAEAAAAQAIETLRRAIRIHSTAVWLLAGGSTPEIAYRVIAKKYLQALDWSKVTCLIGDERIVPLDSPASNWHVAERLLLRRIPKARLLRPASDQTAEVAALRYGAVLRMLPKTGGGYPRLDLVWLGVGGDGHTLSLFPDHPGLMSNRALVIPIHNSPKPPRDRITLTFDALQGSQQCVIMATGNGKAAIIKHIRAGADLPVVTASKISANTMWLVDQVAMGL